MRIRFFAPKCAYGDRLPAVNTIDGIPACAHHARLMKRMGGKSAAQAGRIGKAAAVRKRNQQ